MGISAPLDTPFFGGTVAASSAVTNPAVPYLEQVAINGHAYMIDPTKYQRTTIQAIRQPIDQSVETGEQTLNSEGLWKRGQENWVLGAGQYFLDNRASLYNLYERAGENQSLRYRFWVSKGVNPWTTGQLSLLNATEQKLVDAATNNQLLIVGGDLYYVSGTTLKFTATPTAAPGTFALTNSNIQGGTPANITSATTDGTNIWVAAGGNGIWSSTAGSTTTGARLGSASPNLIGYANGRLITCAANSVTEQNRDGTVTAIGSHKNPNWTWSAIAGSSGAIYLAGYSGSVGEIYALTLPSGGTSLNPPVLVAPLPPGEIPYAMAFIGNFMVIGTNVGIRVADVSSSQTNGLTYGPVITIPGGVNALTAFGEFVWFSWSNLSAPDPLNPAGSITSTGLGRVDLGRFTAAGIPAYATDVQATDGTSGTVNSVVLINNQAYFSVQGGGIWGQNSSYVAKGMVQSGFIRYGTVESKVLASLDYHHDALPNGAAVGCFVVKEDKTQTKMAESNVTGSLGPSSPFDANLLLGESFLAQIYLKPTADLSQTPTLRRYTLRAVVTPKRMDEIIVPIILKTRVQNIQGEGADIWQDVLAEYQFLKNIESLGSIVTYQEGVTTYRCIVDRVEVKPEKWKDDRSFFEGMLMVRLLTIPSS